MTGATIHIAGAERDLPRLRLARAETGRRQTANAANGSTLQAAVSAPISSRPTRTRWSPAMPGHWRKA